MQSNWRILQRINVNAISLDLWNVQLNATTIYILQYKIHENHDWHFILNEIKAKRVTQFESKKKKNNEYTTSSSVHYSDKSNELILIDFNYNYLSLDRNEYPYN